MRVFPPVNTSEVFPSSLVEEIKEKESSLKVPFYSQFNDIDATEWQKLGCGIASLAMLIEFYEPGTVSVNTLLKEGISSGAFLEGAGWKHKGLVDLAQNYNLKGENYDLSLIDESIAFSKLKKALKKGPVIASVHYKLDPQNPIPHLIVVNKIKNNTIYYNDPALESGGKTISIEHFIEAWKKRYIVIHS